MKLMIASDIHGCAPACKMLLEAFAASGAERLILLGDILYHGPRNDLPEGYDPKAVIAMLSEVSDKLFCVRGNCDTEVDQMVLAFPVLADYAILYLGDRLVYATHGHNYNEDKLPPLQKGNILLHGHTHVLCCVEFGDENFYINPGSAALPKENNPKTYMVYENRCFTVKDFDGNTVLEKKCKKVLDKSKNL